MSRSGYTDDGQDWGWLRWRGQVASAIRGKRGQQLLRELVSALEAMPDKQLIKDELRTPEGVCALGAVGAARGMDLEALDPENYDQLAEAFGVAHQLISEIEFINDELADESAATRWQIVHDWAVKRLLPVEWTEIDDGSV